MNTVPRVFFSYSHADASFRDQLEKQLVMLKRQGVIDTWHDRRIGAGQNIEQAISDHVNSDEIILLLISSDFLASDYCYNIELKRAMERHHASEAIVIPVILRTCDWQSATFGKLNATPPDGKPITRWLDIDEAYMEVANAVREAAARVASKTSTPPVVASPLRIPPDSVATPQLREPRSSNLRLAKTFTQREKDQFKLDTFDFMTRFFDNSLAELGARNPGLEGTFRRIDANRFYATIYRNGKDVERCTIYIGDSMFGNGICYVNKETPNGNTMNESLSVETDDQALFLTSAGMASFGRTDNAKPKLSQEGAAELYWGMLINRLQQRA